MSKAHQIQKKEITQPKSETNALATRKKIRTINRKQTPPIQSSIQTHMNLWNSAMGASHQFKNQNLQRFQSKARRSILNAPWYINNHRIHKDLKMNTMLSEIKKRNSKYLGKLENHINALAVNLLDNSNYT
jgi:hypothetical protein